MTYAINVEHRSEQPAAVVRGRVPLGGIPEFLGRAFEAAAAVVGRQGLHIAGPPMARYVPGPEAFDIEAGFPASGAVAPEGDVEPVVLPGGDVATTVHAGAYEDVGAAYDALQSWLADERRAITGPPWECYLDDPTVAVPRTLVCFPCSAPG